MARDAYDRPTVLAFLRALRTFAARFLIALIASFLLFGAALYAADRQAATDIANATPLQFRQGSLHDSGKADDPGQPANFLIVGSDTRGFVHSKVDVSHFGSASQQTGARSDTLMIAHIDPTIKQAMIVSFPRDLVVELPGGCHEKINAAYNQDFRCNSHSPYGGPQQIVDTLKQDFNISINHYVEVNFPGFKDLVDVLGSVPIYFPTKAKDTYTGLVVDGGCNGLSGIMSLNYVRSRHYQYYDYVRGRYVAEAESDLARIRRQQYFIRTLMQTAIDKGAHNILTALDFAHQMSRSLAIDTAFTTSDLKRLIKTFRLTTPGAVQMLTVPTVSAPGGLALADGAEAIFQKLRSFAPKPPEPPKLAFGPDQVNVEVRDATGPDTNPSGASTTTGTGTGSVTASTTTSTAPSTSTTSATSTASTPSAAALDAQTLLRSIGFPVAIGPPAPTEAATVVEYTKANAGKALVLVAHLGAGTQLREVSQLTEGADVALLLGQTGPGVVDPSIPTTTTTTAPTNGPTTTTTAPLPNPGTPPPGTPPSSVKAQWIGCH